MPEDPSEDPFITGVHVDGARYVNAFISHRCKDYDDAPWRPCFEAFLKSHGILPKYGCRKLDSDWYGNMGGSIERAMAKSKMFLAMITESWTGLSDLSHQAWPPEEWKMWNRYWGARNKEIKDNCLGFSLISRDDVLFLWKLFTYEIEIKPLKEEKNILHYCKDDSKYTTIYVKDIDTINNINKELDDMVYRGIEQPEIGYNE